MLGSLGTGKKFITDSRFARAVKQSSVTIGISISNILFSFVIPFRLLPIKKGNFVKPKVTWIW